MNKCVIVGGGVIGLLTARELIQAGLEVILFDKSEAARESSWAGGGILSPLYPWRQPEPITALVRLSQHAYPLLAETLRQATGMDPEWLPSGMLFFDLEDLEAAQVWLSSEQRSSEMLLPSDVSRRFPHLGATSQPALWLPSIAQIRPPRLAQALKPHVQQLGVEMHENTPVQLILEDHGRVVGVELDRGRVEADCVVVAAGAWSRDLLQPFSPAVNVLPVRGQIIAFQTDGRLLSTMVLERGLYLIPRRDGLILAGSTVEHVGFDKHTTDEGARLLTEAARRLLPALNDYAVTFHWAGLRPGTDRGAPYICAHPEIRGLYLNTGHFRNGLTLAPASAQLLANLILEQEPVVDPTPYQFEKK